MKRAACAALAAALALSCGGCGGSNRNAVADPGPPPPRALPASKGAVRYISTQGSDRAAGTRKRPWRTIRKALRTLRPGQTGVVLAGRYEENVQMTRSGRPRAPITLRGRRGAVLAGTGRDAVPLEFAGAGYVRVTGLTIEGATGSSTTDVYASGGAHDIELSRCRIRGSARQGFFSEATTRRIRILRCRIQDNGGQGPRHLDHNIYIEGSGHVVAGNLITGARNGYGIQIYPSSHDILVAFNTIAHNGMGGIVIGSDGPSTTTGARIVNNVIAHNGGEGISTFWGGQVGRDNLVLRNLAWGNAGGAYAHGAGVTLRDNLTGDPRFADEAGGDYRLQRGSPAENRAAAGYAAVIRRTARGGRADLGAYELPR